MSLSKTLDRTWKDYLLNLEKNPIQTKAITAAVISVLSDITAQILSGVTIDQLNITSIRNQFLIGLLSRGPIVHYWYIVLDYIFKKLGYTTEQQDKSTTIALVKTLLDQTIFSIPFNALYFYQLGLLEGRSFDYIQHKLSSEFWTLMIANWKVWPLVNIINFKFVPNNLRVLFGNFIGFLWTIYVVQLTSSKIQ